LLSDGPALTDSAAFHCQQSIEKYLKALLQEADLPVPRIHELDELAKLIPQAKELAKHRRVLKKLSRYAVTYRYVGKHASAPEARSALRLAERFRLQIRDLLGCVHRKPAKKLSSIAD
jgi:HEPN domain-containing protein